jgi:hypothetical protein
MYKLERIPMFISNEVETSHILISIRLYFILTILITEDGPQPSILSDCKFNSSAGEVSGTQAGLWGGLSRYIGTGPGEPESLKIFDFCIIIYFVFSTQIHNFEEVSVCPRAPKQYCSALQNFSWRFRYKVLTIYYVL